MRFEFFHNVFYKRLHEDDKEVHAFGVDDVEGFIPAGVQIITFLDDRLHIVVIPLAAVPFR